MAYKFQLGAAQMSGALVQEGAIKLHNEAGSEVASVKQDGVVSGSAAGKFSTLSIDSVQVFSAAQQLQNVASLDATSEATIEGAIDTLANLSSAGSTGVDLDVLGPLDVQEGIKQNGTEILSDAGALKAIASVSGSGAFQGGSATFGLSVTAGTSFIIGSADLNETDMEKLDGITNGTVAASKAVVVDANKDAAGFRDISGRTVSGSGNATFMGNYVGGGSVTAGSSFIIGSADLNETDLEKLDGITDGTVAANKAIVVDANKDFSGLRNATATGAITAGTSFVIGSADLNEADMEKLDGITNGTAAASKALVLDASKNLTGITNLTASFFKGDGSGLTNVDAVTNVSASSANVAYELAFTEYLGSDVELGGNAGLTFNPAGNNGANGFSGSLVVSASHAGEQMSRILLGSKDEGQLFYKKDGSDLVLGLYSANAGIDISASTGGGIVLAGGDAAGTIVKGDGMFFVQDASETTKASINGSSGVISGSSNLTLLGNATFDGRLVANTVDSKIAATDTAIADGDSLYFLDATDGSKIKKESLADVASLFAGDGLAAASSVIKLDLNELSAAAIADGDFLAFVDATDNSTKKEAVADLASLFAGAGLAAASSVIGIANATNGGIGVQANDIKVDLNDLAAGAVDVAADSIAIVDANDSNKSKKESISDLVSAMAGAGLSATSGVLAVQGSSVALKADGETLAEGYNYLADLSSNATVSLPAAPSVGDVVHVKAADLTSGANVIIQKQGSHTIDDDHTAVRIESSFGAVSLVYVVANKWRLV